LKGETSEAGSFPTDSLSGLCGSHREKENTVKVTTHKIGFFIKYFPLIVNLYMSFLHRKVQHFLKILIRKLG